tara:strand:- start:1520 stop:1798 length:279 start_codon:yes stop_codon:yes gene_type:complete
MILLIKTRNKDFNLLQNMQKNLGIVFHPNTTLDQVVNLIKETANANEGTPKASREVRQSDLARENFVRKTEKATGEKKADGMEDTSNKVSPI